MGLSVAVVIAAASTAALGATAAGASLLLEPPLPPGLATATQAGPAAPELRPRAIRVLGLGVVAYVICADVASRGGRSDRNL